MLIMIVSFFCYKLTVYMYCKPPIFFWNEIFFACEQVGKCVCDFLGDNLLLALYRIISMRLLFISTIKDFIAKVMPYLTKNG